MAVIENLSHKNGLTRFKIPPTGVKFINCFTPFTELSQLAPNFYASKSPLKSWALSANSLAQGINQFMKSTFGKSYTREGSATSFEKLEKPVWRPKGGQLSKFRRMLFTIMKINCCISLWSPKLFSI